MNLREIKYFLMVAECLSYSAAAAKLYISQPSLSKVISQMEEDLGFKLFRRSTRKVELTEEGRGFYAISKAYMEQCDRLIQGELPAETIRGKLSIAFEVTMDTLYMPFIVAAFQQKYPNISVTVSKQKTEVLIQHLRNQKVNLGLMSSFAVPSMGFQKQLLFPYQLQILVWKGHAFCGEKSVKLKDLAHETFVILDPSVSRSSKTVLQLFSAILKFHRHAAPMGLEPEDGVVFERRDDPILLLAEAIDRHIIHILGVLVQHAGIHDPAGTGLLEIVDTQTIEKRLGVSTCHLDQTHGEVRDPHAIANQHVLSAPGRIILFHTVSSFIAPTHMRFLK